MFIQSFSRFLHAKFMVLTIVALRLSACAPAAQSPKDAPGATDPTELALLTSYSAPQTARTIATEGSRRGLEAVAVASQSGRLVTTGTFTESAQGWTYDAQPSDRMVIVTSDDLRVEYIFEIIEGSDTSSVDNFLYSDHRLVFEISSEAYGTLAIQSARVGQDRQMQINGVLNVSEKAYTVDINITGRDYFENDSSGMEYQDEHHTNGTIQGENYLLTIDDHWYFDMISLPGESAISDSTNIINSGLALNDENYQWDNCKLQKSFAGGQPSQSDYWQGSGGLRRNGEPYGQCGFYGTEFTVGFALYTDNAELVLEEWILPGKED